MRPLNTFFGLYAARETIFNQNVDLEDIWVWDPWSKGSVKIRKVKYCAHFHLLWELRGPPVVPNT